MSRLWDTSEFYARTEADELLRDFPTCSAIELADSFVQIHPAYERDPQFAREIGAELRKRADAGVRFWPENTGVSQIEEEVRALIGAAACTGSSNEADSGPDDAFESVYWWQRM